MTPLDWPAYLEPYLEPKIMTLSYTHLKL